MSKEDATLQDGSPAPKQEKPFPNNQGEGEPTDPRSEALNQIGDSFEAHRAQEIKEAVENDPGIAYRQQEMQQALDRENGRNAEQLDTADDAADKVADTLDDGAQGRQPLHPQADTEKPALPEELRDDPLADYIEMVDGRPMFRMKVDGEVVHKDLDAVRTEAQKAEAADRRLMSASEWQKDLQQREARIAQRERELESQPKVVSPPPEQRADVDDLDIDTVSKDIVTSMFSGTEEEAAQKLAETFKKIKGSGQPVAQIDPNELVQQAKKAAREELDQDNYQKNVNTAWTDFTTSYKDVHDSPEAFAFADSQSSLIEKEHPDWGPREVMMEAGARARRIVLEPQQRLAELEAKQDDPPKPAPDADRQANKSNLRPLPQSRTATYEEPKGEDPNAVQSPQEALAQIRGARNQPV